MNLPWYQEAVYHFMSGVAISFADRLFSKNAKRHTDERVKDKVSQLEAIKFLRDVEEGGTLDDVADSTEYLQAISKARDHFKSSGERASLYKEGDGVSGWLLRRTESIAFYKDHERLNNRSIGGKFGAAFGIEFVADSIVAVSQIYHGVGNGIKAIGESVAYQGVSMFAGLMVGKWILKAKDYLTRSKEEKEMDELIPELTRDGKVLAMVRDYNPVQCEEVQKVLPAEVIEGGERPSRKLLTRGVNGVLERLKSAGESVEGVYNGAVQRVKDKAEQRRVAEVARQEEIRSRYDNY